MSCGSSGVVSFLVFEKHETRKKTKKYQKLSFWASNDQYSGEKVVLVGVQHF
jgi:hypothetical protein